MAADRCRYGPIGAEFWSFSMVTLDWSQVKNIIGDIKVDIFFALGGILPQKEGRKRPFLVFFDQNPKNQRFYAFTRKFLAMIFISFLLARVLNNLPKYTFKLFPGWALQIRSHICDFRWDLILTPIFHLKFELFGPVRAPKGLIDPKVSQTFSNYHISIIWKFKLTF